VGNRDAWITVGVFVGMGASVRGGRIRQATACKRLYLP
jgi:hypothetical protein